MISIILPVYNEEDYIERNTISIIKEMKKITKDYEIVIIEESTDRTPELIKNLQKKYKKIRHFHFDERLGKGHALEYGIKSSMGDKIIFTDIDLSTDISSLKAVANELSRNDIVIGSRYHKASRIQRTPLRVLISKVYSFALRLLLSSRIRDYQCGLKGFSKTAGREVIRYTTSDGTFWDTEFLFFAQKLGFTIKEIPVTWVETKGRSVKISLKLILKFVFSLVRLFFKNLSGDYSKIKK